ncbi:hypothetical protein K1719_012305 [Acacia pycnantha]|nr:hypothetical protein K1719_012305 [Acacia pycnantha]
MNSLIVKLLGKSVNVGFMRFRMERMWASKGPLRVTPLNNGYFLVSFSSTGDRDYALQEGPWMIADHYLLVQRWRPNFNPWNADSQKRVAVWVCIPDLPHELYNVESIRRIGNMIGRTLKIDRTTAFSEKGGFARMCVEVDLQKPLLPGFCHFGDERRFEYEGLHLVCFSCGKYGHRMEQCTNGKLCQATTIGVDEGSPVEAVDAVVPEKTKSDGVVDGEMIGDKHHVNYGPRMLVKRDFRKGVIIGESKVSKTVGTLNKAEKRGLGVMEGHDSRDPGNGSGAKEWIQVGSKRKVGAKVKARRKENKLGIKAQARAKGKSDALEVRVDVVNSMLDKKGPKGTNKEMEVDIPLNAGAQGVATDVAHDEESWPNKELMDQKIRFGAMGVKDQVGNPDRHKPIIASVIVGPEIVDASRIVEVCVDAEIGEAHMGIVDNIGNRRPKTQTQSP